ncbi:uncharacterized protein LOC135818479 [Sycon ciliatum]|uniref:uncharacterized protein LOC135818479 n=1 Tax=Sycon ciliatum TaxID=27933 RepID=UPI0020AB788E
MASLLQALAHGTRWVWLAMLVCVSVCPWPSRCEECVRYDDQYQQGACKCRLSSDPKLGLDLTPLRNMFSTPKEGLEDNVYVWGPCGDVLNFGGDCTAQARAAACQGPTFGKPPTWNSLGIESSAVFTVNLTGTDLVTTITYSNGTEGRTSEFKLICNEDSNGTFDFVGEHPTKHYNFIVTSRDVCLVAVPTTGGNGGGGLSAGSIILILVISLAVVYLVAGGLYQKLARGATGWEIVPNRDMWMTVPELVTDGMAFILSPCRAPFKGRGKMSYENL